MSVFDSPIARCDAVREMVLTDETQAECAREHACPAGRICPLCGSLSTRQSLRRRLRKPRRRIDCGLNHPFVRGGK